MKLLWDGSIENIKVISGKLTFKQTPLGKPFFNVSETIFFMYLREIEKSASGWWEVKENPIKTELAEENAETDNE